MNDWVPQACCDMISGGIKYIAGICFPPLSGSDDTADKYTSSKVEEPRQQNKYVLCSIILVASSYLLGVETRTRRLLLPNSDCFLFAQYGFCTRHVILYYCRDFGSNIRSTACSCTYTLSRNGLLHTTENVNVIKRLIFDKLTHFSTLT